MFDSSNYVPVFEAKREELFLVQQWLLQTLCDSCVLLQISNVILELIFQMSMRRGKIKCFCLLLCLRRSSEVVAAKSAHSVGVFFFFEGPVVKIQTEDAAF